MDTITSLIDASCRTYADRTALRHKEGGGWRELSYERLRAAAELIAGGLTVRGLKPGERAALLAPSSPQWVMAYLGILQAGGVAVPIDKDLKRIEMRHILTHSETRILFCGTEQWAGVAALAEELPALALVVLVDAAEGARNDGPAREPRDPLTVLPLHALHGSRGVSPVPCHPDDIALILYTSGTTGRSKGAMLSHANVVSNIHGAAAHLQVDETIHTLSFLPIAHVFEQVCGVLLPLALGGKVTFCESLKKLADNLAEVRPTFFVGVPAFYRLVFERVMKKIAGNPLSRMLFAFPPTRLLIASPARKKLGAGTIFISGGAALDPALARGFARLGVIIYQGYGITETSPVIAAEAPDGSRPGTVGRVLREVEVRIENPDSDGVGEIVVWGPNVMQGYYKDPQATAAALSGGWYRTGDLGRLDRDGFLTICGRAKNLIVTPNGRNVYPEEVENEILKSAFVAEVVVYADRAGEVEEEIRALVYPDREALADRAREQGRQPLAAGETEALIRAEVAAACRRLADYKRVRKVTLSEEEFPKTATRKIKRYEVAGMEPGGSETR